MKLPCCPYCKSIQISSRETIFSAISPLTSHERFVKCFVELRPNYSLGVTEVIGFNSSGPVILERAQS